MDNIKTTFQSLIFSLALASTMSQAGQAEIDQIESASASLNVAALNQMKTQFQGYDQAFAHYRLALSANLTGQDDLAKTAINAAKDLLEHLDEENPNQVEIKALLAQVYGYKISLEPMKGLYYGPKSQSKLEQAKALDANNPRVLLVQGIGAINTPAMFGGSETLAFESFTKAITAYNQDQSSDYHWGYAEAYTWRGIMHQQRGDLELAKADWQQALNIAPNYGWAQSLMTEHQ